MVNKLMQRRLAAGKKSDESPLKARVISTSEVPETVGSCVLKPHGSNYGRWIDYDMALRLREQGKVKITGYSRSVVRLHPELGIACDLCGEVFGTRGALTSHRGLSGTGECRKWPKGLPERDRVRLETRQYRQRLKIARENERTARERNGTDGQTAETQEE